MLVKCMHALYANGVISVFQLISALIMVKFKLRGRTEDSSVVFIRGATTTAQVIEMGMYAL